MSRCPKCGYDPALHHRSVITRDGRSIPLRDLHHIEVVAVDGGWDLVGVEHGTVIRHTLGEVTYATEAAAAEMAARVKP